MELEEICKGGFHKVLKAEIPAGGGMEEHYTTSDAFVVVVDGNAKLIFKDKQVDLCAGSAFLIPGLKPHSLIVSSDLKAFFTLAPMGKIKGLKTNTKQ